MFLLFSVGIGGDVVNRALDAFVCSSTVDRAVRRWSTVCRRWRRIHVTLIAIVSISLIVTAVTLLLSCRLRWCAR